MLSNKIILQLFIIFIIVKNNFSINISIIFITHLLKLVIRHYLNLFNIIKIIIELNYFKTIFS